jgi:hypothetical protein
VAGDGCHGLGSLAGSLSKKAETKLGLLVVHRGQSPLGRLGPARQSIRADSAASLSRGSEYPRGNEEPNSLIIVKKRSWLKKIALRVLCALEAFYVVEFS